MKTSFTKYATFFLALLLLTALGNNSFSQSLLLAESDSPMGTVITHLASIQFISIDTITENRLEASANGISAYYEFTDNQLKATHLRRTFTNKQRSEIGLNAMLYFLEQQQAKIIPDGLDHDAKERKFFAHTTENTYNITYKVIGKKEWSLEVNAISNSPVLSMN